MGNRGEAKVKNTVAILARSVVTVFLLGLVPLVVDVFLEQRVRNDILSRQIGSDFGTERTGDVDLYVSEARNEAKKNKQPSPQHQHQHQHQTPLPEPTTTLLQTTISNKTAPSVSHTIQNEDEPNPVTQTTSVPGSSTTTRNITSVRVNVDTPVLYSEENTLPRKRKLKFYLLKIPFLTTDLMENQTHYEHAKRWAVRPRTLNELPAEIWIHRGLERMTYEQGRTTDPNEADIFFIIGYHNLRFEIFGEDFPRNEELDRYLEPLIVDKSKPHVYATPRVLNMIGIKWMINSLKKIGVRKIHSLGFERNSMWQDNVDLARIVTVPYVAKPLQSSREELQAAILQATRTPNYTFYAGDSRPLGPRFGGCDRPNLLKHLLNSTDAGSKTTRDVSLFYKKYSRLTQHMYNHRMQTSDYCLILCGDTPTSRVLASSMIAGCIPLFVGSRWRGLCEGPCHRGWGWQIANLPHYPYPHLIDWNAFPEVSEEEFVRDPIGALEEIYTIQSPERRQEIRDAMHKTQLSWVYGWGNPIDSEEFGDAAETIWASVEHHFHASFPEEVERKEGSTSDATSPTTVSSPTLPPKSSSVITIKTQ